MDGTEVTTTSTEETVVEMPATEMTEETAPVAEEMTEAPADVA